MLIVIDPVGRRQRMLIYILGEISLWQKLKSTARECPTLNVDLSL